MTRTVLTNATLIDCVQPAPVEASVVIENGRIAEILTGGRQPAADGAAVVDLAGAYLLPGLWDVHVHPDYLTLADMPLADQVALFGHRLMSADLGQRAHQAVAEERDLVGKRHLRERQ